MLSRNLQDSGVAGLVLMYTGVSPSVPVMRLSFDVINIVDLRTLSLPDAKFSIDALTALDSKSVVFSNGQCETAAPLAYCGNSGYVFNSCPNLVLGANVTITATSFSEKYCAGVTISSRSVKIHIIKTSPPILPTPVVSEKPVAAPTEQASDPAPIQSLMSAATKAPVSTVTMAPFQTKAPTTAPTPTVRGISELVLMYTGVDPSIPVMKLSSESINIVDLQALSLPFDAFNIDAKITTHAKSVVFSNGQYETAAPLAYCGNVGYSFKTCPDLVLGANITVTAVAFSKKYGSGVVVSTRSVTLHIIKSDPPAVSNKPTVAPIASKIPTTVASTPTPPQPAPTPTVPPSKVPATVPPVKKCGIPRVRFLNYYEQHGVEPF